MGNNVEQIVKSQRTELDAWLAENYSDWPKCNFSGEHDASYPRWDDVENLVAEIFDQRLISKLKNEALDSVLFFISRSDEIGRIVAWLNKTPGSLTCTEFLYQSL